LSRHALSLFLLLGMLAWGTSAKAAYCDGGHPVSFADINWESGEFITAVTEEIVERGLGCHTTGTPGNSVTLELAVANDDVNVFAEEWTGRTDIWQFAIDNIRVRPLFGHGFGAFWETPFTYFQPIVEGSEVAFASHSHNGFLDLALTIGIPGLALALIWTLVLPLRDFQRCKESGADPELTALFLRIWMFGVLACGFESLLFDRGNPTWFTMLAAMFGLRYLSVLRLG